MDHLALDKEELEMLLKTNKSDINDLTLQLTELTTKLESKTNECIDLETRLHKVRMNMYRNTCLSADIVILYTYLYEFVGGGVGTSDHGQIFTPRTP